MIEKSEIAQRFSAGKSDRIEVVSPGRDDRTVLSSLAGLAATAA